MVVRTQPLVDGSEGEHGPPSGITPVRGRADSLALEAFCDKAETRKLLWTDSQAAIGAEFDI